jgi:hypothetical protein
VSDGHEPRTESADTISDDIHALADAVTTCIEAITLLGERRLQPAMLQALNNEENILAAILRRYDPERRQP